MMSDSVQKNEWDPRRGCSVPIVVYTHLHVSDDGARGRDIATRSTLTVVEVQDEDVAPRSQT